MTRSGAFARLRATWAIRETGLATAAPFLLVALLYNPVFNYEALFLRSFTGGQVRALLSLVVFGLLAFVLYRRRLPAVNLPSLRSILVVAAVLAFGTLRGFLNGATPREIGGDLFPLAELFSYALIFSWLIRDPRSARLGVLTLTFWVGAVAATEIVLYTRLGDQFSTRVLLDGCTVPRLDDFMPVLFLPVAIAGAALLPARTGGALALAALALAIAVAISFFRTIWLATVVGLLALFLAFARDTRPLLRIAAVAAAASVAVALALAILPRVLAYTPVCVHEVPAPATASPAPVGGTSAPSVRSPAAATFTPPPFTELVGARADPVLAQVEPASFSGRITANMDILRGVKNNALLGVGFGGTFVSSSSGQALPLSSAPNYFAAMTMELGVPAMLALLVVVLPELWRALRAVYVGSGPLSWLGRASFAGIVGILVTLMIFPAPLHFALGPFAALLVRAARHAASPA